MKRSITYRITALVLACMVFLSTSMTSMSVHFCSGKIAGVGLFQHESTLDSCCEVTTSKCQKAANKEDCCKDEFIDLDWDTDITIPLSEAGASDLELVAILQPISGLTINSIQSTTTPQSYVPPLLLEDKAILFQQFLI